MRAGWKSWLAVTLVTLLACAPGEDGGAVAVGALGTQAQALTGSLSEGFESGLGSWTAETTSGVATWHVVDHPENLSVSPALNPVAVTLADDGAHLPAAGGTHVVWFGNDDTGTFVGSDFPQPPTPKGGGSSNETQTGTLTSPAVTLAGGGRLAFDAWWEIEGTAAASYDLMQVSVSKDGGAFTLLAQLNPSFAAVQPSYAAYSSGGPAAPPVWHHYVYDLSSYAGSSVRIRFTFNSKDTNYNAFRGFTVDNVEIDGTALPAPTLTGASPAVGTSNALVTLLGSGFVQGAVFSIGTTAIPGSAITQFGTDSVIFKVPALAVGVYDVKVTNPDGQGFTLPAAFTYTTNPSPAVSGISPNSGNLFTAQAVTISGSNFGSGATVTIGTTPATNVVVVSASQLTATVPALPAGGYNVTVSSADGQSGTLYSGYTVTDQSTFELLSPNGGETWGAGTSQEITWSATGASLVGIDLFKNGTLVSTLADELDASTGSFTWAIPTDLPLGSDYTVKVYNPNGTSGALSASPFSITLSLTATTTTVQSALNPSPPEEGVTFTATVSPATATGSVQFAVDGVAFGAPVAVSGGTAVSGEDTALAAGTHTVTATFSGTGLFASSSGSLTQTVNTAPTATAQSVTTAEDTAKAITLAGSDADGDALGFALVTAPAHGTLSGTAPDLSYTPDANYHGADSFTFIVNDKKAQSAAATVSLTVTSVNDAPVADAQAVTTQEDTAKAITLSATDADGDALTYAVVTPPAHGTVTLSGATATYTPAANYHGPDSFTFKAQDAAVSSSVATVSITVGAVNDAPVATSQAVDTDEDSSVSIALSGTDLDGDALSYTVGAPSHGTLTGSEASRTYVPAANYHGPDSFTFTVSDGTATSSAATVSIAVASVNDAPVAASQSVTTDEDTSRTVTLTGTDADGDELGYAVTQPAHGIVTLVGATATYTPAANYHGPDSFTFKANDGQVDSAPATVSVTVTAVNDVPVATGQSVSTEEDTAQGITLTGTDADEQELGYAVTQPAHGTVTLSGAFAIYTPATNYHGPDSFTFTVSDGQVDSAPATVSITVTAVNDVPVAAGQSVSTEEDTALTVTLTGTDADEQELDYAVVTQPAHGTVTLSGAFAIYTPAANYHGPDGFTFTASDGTATSSVATVSVTVSSVNDAPVAADDVLTLDEDGSQAVTLTGTDVDGDELRYAVVTQPAHGTVTLSGATATYTPAANYHGPDGFTFKVNDGQVDSAPATVSVSVAAVNDAPVAEALSLELKEDGSQGFALGASDTDGDALTYTVVTPPAHGSLNGSGAYRTYIPAANYNGPDSFSFQVNDGSADSNVATVSLTVTAVNDAPVANGQALTLDEDGSLPLTLTGSDVEGSALTFTVVTPPAHGTLTGTGASRTYVPAANFHGADSFTFRVNDGSADSGLATVAFTVNAVNDAPVADAGSFATAEDVAVPVPLGASDLDGDALTYSVVTPPAHGTLTGSGAALTYVPDADYHGPDGFTFQVADGSAASNVASVGLTVASVNDAPVAKAQALPVAEDGTVSISLAASDVDGDALTFSVLTPPAHGTLSGTAPALTYVPDANFHGVDGFTFAAGDGTASSPATAISINVLAANDAPVAQGDEVQVDEDTAQSLTLSGSDLDGDALRFRVLRAPAHGTLSGTAPNLTYLPASNYTGPDEFTFTVNDGSADAEPATVSLQVNAVDDRPVAQDQALTVAEDVAQTVTLNGSDVEGAALTYRVVQRPAHGTLSGTAPELVYTPAPDFHGDDHFTFTVTADGVESAPATVSLTVQGRADALTGGGGGMGCSTSGSGNAPILFLALGGLLFLRRRSRVSLSRRAVGVLGAAALAVPVAAQAQGRLPAFEVETLRPSASAAGSLVTETGLLLPPDSLRLALTVGYEEAPLLYFRDGEQVGEIVGSRTTAYLTGAWAPTSRLQLSAALPLVLDQRGDDLSRYGLASPTSTTVGTAWVEARLAVLQQHTGHALDVAVSLGLSAPVGSLSAVARESGVGLLPQVALGRQVSSWLRLGGELGVALRPTARFDGASLGRNAVDGALVAHTTNPGLRGELSWRFDVPTDGNTSGSELIGGARLPAGRGLEVYALGGVGLTDGVGTPAYRALVGLGWTLDVGARR